MNCNNKTLKDLGIKFPFHDCAISMVAQKEQPTLDFTKLLGMEKKRHKDPWFQENAKKMRIEEDKLIPSPSLVNTNLPQISHKEILESQREFSVMKEQCELKAIALLNQIEAIRLLLNAKKAENTLALNEVLERMAAEIDSVKVETELTTMSTPTTSFSNQEDCLFYNFDRSPDLFLQPFHFEDPFE